MCRNYRLALRDMRDAAARILAKVADTKLEELQTDRDLQDIVQLNLIKLGEAAKLVPESFRTTHAEIDWRRAAGMRDRLVHAYFGIKWELVLQTVRSDLPPMLSALEALLGIEDNDKSQETD